MKPDELALAEVLDGLAQRYGKLPSEILEADVFNLQVALLVTTYEQNRPPQ